VTGAPNAAPGVPIAAFMLRTPPGANSLQTTAISPLSAAATAAL
jgi:hypothetical protein